MLNPVEQRLLLLCDHWQTFSSKESKRLLVWQVPANAMRMLSCFFETQKQDTEYSTGDVFIVFDTPFENSIQYSKALKEALKGQYDASTEELKQQGIKPDWQFKPEQFPDTAIGFIASLVSFVTRHTEITGKVVATLLPQNIANEKAFNDWLLSALNLNIPKNLRLMVTDSTEHSQLSELLKKEHSFVYLDSPKIDMLTIAQETFAQEGGVGPAAVFRNFLMGLVALVEKGSISQVKTKATDALAFAQKQKWPDQEVVVTMLFAGALLKEKLFSDAIREYKYSRKMVKQCEIADHPAALDLKMQTWFGEAGAHLAEGNDVLAAECYDQAAIVAQQIPNFILAIEAHRMSGFCYARAKQNNNAIERGSLALKAGEQLEPSDRMMTTMPLAAVDILRVVEPDRVKKLEEIKHRQDEDQEKARTVAEQRAASLKGKNDPKLFTAIEDDLESDYNNAQHTAALKLEVVVADSGELFRQYFTRGKNLLGEQWPLDSAIALPSAPAG